MNLVDGEIICIDKPLGWTSFDAVKRVRGAILRRLGVKKFKVGHAGTLDPLATGVMIITTGRATKRIEQLQAGVKEYVADIALGATTPSFDLGPRLTPPSPPTTSPAHRSTKPSSRLPRPHRAGAPSLLGLQGRRKTRLRPRPKGTRGKPQGKTPRHRRNRAPRLLPRAIRIRVVCSKGTYIRALARDIGQALGSGAHLTALRRTRVGDVSIADCLSIDQAAAIIAEAPSNSPTARQNNTKQQ